jgi:pimeloyl-ACP methyl ester carboxylesterase
MPYANNNGVRIYYEVEGQGPPLVLLHGAFQDLDVWRENGYVDALKNDYRLILRDDRAHGRSNRQYNPEEHTFENNAKDIIAVLDELGIESAHFFGFSGGGQHALTLAVLAPQRTKSVIVFGMSPRFQGSDANKQILQLIQAGPEALTDFIENSMRNEPVSKEAKKRVRATDFDALDAALSRPPEIDIENALPIIAMPILVLVGEDDNFFDYRTLQEEYRKVPDLTFVSLPGIGHDIERSDLVLPHVKEFLARVNK